MMNNIVTHQFLRKRFWVVTFVLLAAIAGSVGIMIQAVGAQADRDNYLAAFHHLSDAAIRLERELTKLSDVPEGAAVDRQKSLAAFVELLTEFRTISVLDLSKRSYQYAAAQSGATDPHLAGLGAEFGIYPDLAAARRHLGAIQMPAALNEIWKPSIPAAQPALEYAISRLLRLSAPLVRRDGGFNGVERRLYGEIEDLAFSDAQTAIARVVKVLDAEDNRIADALVIGVLALLGFAIATVLFNFFAIFRPLERVVMASQNRILSEHQKVLTAHQSNRDFLSMVSHELRTPMNGVLGFASLLAASDLKPRQRKQVEIIQSSGKTLLSLVDDLLDFAKIEAGSLVIEDENFSVEDVVSDVITLLRAGTVAKGLEMSVHIDARLPENSRGDGNRLRQILTNLVGNAIKFTDSGSIGVEARMVSASPYPSVGRELEFAVSDTGIGIPPDKTEMIFDRFIQGDTNTRRKCGGTGLGLAICKQLVDRMGGRIWVESMQGAGSTFFVRLPLVVANPPVAESGWRDGAIAALSGHRVLVVDDCSISRRLIRLQLESYGLRVDDAADEQSGWVLLEKAVATQDLYTAAILDHMMPKIDGVELVHRIRSDGQLMGLRLMLISPSANCDLSEAQELGFDAVEEKPVLPRALIDTLCRLIGEDADLRKKNCERAAAQPGACAYSAGRGQSGRPAIGIGDAVALALPG